MGGFGTVSSGASSAIGASNLENAKLREMRKRLKIQQKEWIKTSSRVLDYFSRNQLNITIFEKSKGPVTTMKTFNKANFQTAFLATRHHRMLIASVDNYNLAETNKHMGFDPVDLISGAYVFNSTDISFPSNAPIKWAWTWESLNMLRGSLGNRIHFSLDTHFLYLQDETKYVFVDLYGKKHWLPFMQVDSKELIKEHGILITKTAEGFRIKYNSDPLIYEYRKLTPSVFRLTSINNTRGFSSNFYYEESNKLERIEDANGDIYNLAYNSEGLISNVLVNNKIVASYNYDENGNLLDFTNQRGNKVCFKFLDDLIIEKIDEEGNSHYWKYDSSNRVIQTWGKNHNYEGFISYDELNRCNKAVDALGKEQEYFYNEEGLLLSKKEKDGDTVSYKYNNDNRLVKKTSNFFDKSYKYDYMGRLLEESNTIGIIKKNIYDEEGNLIYCHDRDESSYKYDRYGNLQEMKVNNQLVVNNIVDEKTKLIKESILENQSISYKYDEFGNLLEMESEQFKILFYKNLKIKKIINYGDKNCSYDFVYNEEDLIQQIQKSSGEPITIEHDKKCRIIAVSSQMGTMKWEYDEAGNVISEKGEKDSLNYSYDKNGNLLKINYNNKQIFECERDVNGNIVKQQILDFPEMTFHYVANRVEYRTFGKEFISYRYDEKGNIFEKVLNKELWEAYDFDSDNNIIRAENPFSLVELSHTDFGKIQNEKISMKNENVTIENEYLDVDEDSNETIINQNIRLVSKRTTKFESIKMFFRQQEIFESIYWFKSKNETINITNNIEIENKSDSHGIELSIKTDSDDSSFYQYEERKNINKEQSQLSQRVEKLRRFLETNLVNLMSEETKKNWFFDTIMRSNGDSLSYFDGLGRIIAEVFQNKAIRYHWVKDQIFSISTIDLTSNLGSEKNFFYLKNGLLIFEKQDQLEGTLITYKNYDFKTAYVINSITKTIQPVELKLDFEKQNLFLTTADSHYYLTNQEESEKVIQTKFHLEKWLSTPNNQFNFARNKNLLLLNYKDVKNAVAQILHDTTQVDTQLFQLASLL